MDPPCLRAGRRWSPRRQTRIRHTGRGHERLRAPGGMETPRSAGPVTTIELWQGSSGRPTADRTPPRADSSAPEPDCCAPGGPGLTTAVRAACGNGLVLQRCLPWPLGGSVVGLVTGGHLADATLRTGELSAVRERFVRRFSREGPRQSALAYFTGTACSAGAEERLDARGGSRARRSRSPPPSAEPASAWAPSSDADPATVRLRPRDRPGSAPCGASVAASRRSQAHADGVLVLCRRAPAGLVVEPLSCVQAWASPGPCAPGQLVRTPRRLFASMNKNHVPIY
jgi:hypothetical protein